jgi:hypothetical protein
MVARHNVVAAKPTHVHQVAFACERAWWVAIFAVPFNILQQPDSVANSWRSRCGHVPP